MRNFKIYNETLKPSENEKDVIVNFLHQHLEEFGDKPADIRKCLNFAVKEHQNAMGGFVLILTEDNEVKGITIINKTGMSGYIPENILVYIAVHSNARGIGIGKDLMKKALELAEGDVALHVEATNPAKFLYEKLGFENKYLEMRLKK